VSALAEALGRVLCADELAAQREQYAEKLTGRAVQYELLALREADIAQREQLDGIAIGLRLAAGQLRGEV